VVQLQIDAEDADQARRQAEDQGLRVLSCAQRGTLRGLAWRRARTFDLVLFSQELTTLLNAGLPLIDALESLAEKAPQAARARCLAELVRQLYEGRSLSQALGQQPRVFPPLYVALVQSSERTGALGDALTRYIGYRQRLDLVRQKLVGASVYPLLLLLVGGGVVLFLLGYVVPRFSQVFEGMGTELPWLSRVLMQIGLFLHAQQLPWRWHAGRHRCWSPCAATRRAPLGLASCAASRPAPAPGDVRAGAFLSLAGDSAAGRHPHPHRHGHGPGLLGSAAAEAWSKPASAWAKGCRCPMHWKPGNW
jgi:hypothetical protein